MRIAHIATTISLNQIVLNQMLYQKEKGHEVVAMGPDDEWAPGIREKGIRFVHVPFLRHNLPATGWSAFVTRSVCRRERFDVVHTHNALPGVMGRIGARLARVPCVLHTWHSWPARLARPFYITAGFKFFEPIATRLADAVLFLNPDDMDAWAAYSRVDTSKARLIGNGINVKQLQARVSPDARRRIRAELGLAEDAYAVVKIARMEHPRKGHVFFLEAMQRLMRSSPRNIVVWLVGQGDGEPAIREAVARLGIGDRVRFLGYRKDVPDVLSACDLSVLASPFEGVPRALMESMAVSVPVVGTDVPGTRMLVKSGESGLLAPFGDVEGLAAAMRRLLDDPQLARRLAANGRARVETRFNEPDVAERVLRVYEHVLARPRDPLPHFEAELDLA